MSSKKRRASPLPLVGLSLALLFVPSSYSQKARLTLLAGFGPFQYVGQTASRKLLPLLSAGSSEDLVRQNGFLRDERLRLVNENAVLRHKLDQASALQQYIKEENFQLLHADVALPADGSPWRRSLTLALGSEKGVRKGMLVLYHNQLIGRVLEAAPWTSRVQLVTDPGFKVTAVAAPKTYTAGVPFDSRHTGVYEGTSAEKGVLKWFSGDSPVEAGAYVLTTEDPLNGVPRGLLVGRVASNFSGRRAYPRVDVEPMVNFAGLEHVMLLVKR